MTDLPLSSLRGCLLVLHAVNRFGNASLESTLALERTFSSHFVQRSGLTLDARFIPPLEGSSDRVHVFVTARGEFAFDAPIREHFEGPAAFALSEDAFEGAGGRRTCFFRSTGSPFIGLDLFLRRTSLVKSDVVGPTRLALGPRVFELVGDLAGIDSKDSPAWAEKMREILHELAREGVVTADVARSVRAGDRRFGRLWSGLAPLAQKFYLLSTLDEISSITGISVRQVKRDMDEFVDAFHFGLAGWRSEMRRLRLKIAVLGLSAEQATVSDVARATGYGSTEAMARAFRDAGLPTPSAVRTAFD